jgi:hypothetical protein
MGCEVPRTFFLRFQAMVELRGMDTKVILGLAIEEEITKWEKKLDKRTASAYDALLEIKAYQNNFSVNNLKNPLRIVTNSRGKKVIYPPQKIVIPHDKNPDILPVFNREDEK